MCMQRKKRAPSRAVKRILLDGAGAGEDAAATFRPVFVLLPLLAGIGGTVVGTRRVVDKLLGDTANAETWVWSMKTENNARDKTRRRNAILHVAWIFDSFFMIFLAQ